MMFLRLTFRSRRLSLRWRRLRQIDTSIRWWQHLPRTMIPGAVFREFPAKSHRKLAVSGRNSLEKATNPVTGILLPQNLWNTMEPPASVPECSTWDWSRSCSSSGRQRRRRSAPAQRRFVPLQCLSTKTATTRTRRPLHHPSAFLCASHATTTNSNRLGMTKTSFRMCFCLLLFLSLFL